MLNTGDAAPSFELQDQNGDSVQVVGVSPQSASSHKRFAEAFSLPFPLLSDTRKTAIRAYGVDGGHLALITQVLETPPRP